MTDCVGWIIYTIHWELINGNFGHLICKRKINQAIVIYSRIKLLSNFFQMNMKLTPYISMHG